LTALWSRTRSSCIVESCRCTSGSSTAAPATSTSSAASQGVGFTRLASARLTAHHFRCQV
jgi:hypothetical protein